MKRVLIVIAQEGYQDQEFAGTRDGLVQAGFDPVVASIQKGMCVGKFGGTQEASIALQDVHIDDYDRVAFIGGPGAKALAMHPDAIRIAQAFVNAGKPVGAICIAPTILAAAGVLVGKRATVWNNDGVPAQMLAERGATYVAEPVVQDGRIMTADGPQSAEAFGTAFAAMPS